MSISEAFQAFVQNLSPLYDLGEAHSIARIIFEDVFQIRDFQNTKTFTSHQQAELEAIGQRLLKHEPVQYVIGQADFYGLKFKVNPSVLIPRQETEELVFWIIETIKNSKRSNYKVLDIGTGSGCIPIALKSKVPQLQVSAIDISAAALKIASENAQVNKVLISFKKCDILDQNTWSDLDKYDIIVSNPPYIPPRERNLMPKHVLAYEPELALFVHDDDPLLFYRNIAEFALKYLEPGGWLFFECNEFTAHQVMDLLRSKNFFDLMLQHDLNGKERMIRCRVS